MREDTRRLLVELLEMSGGPLLWLAHLLFVYTASALICAGRAPLESSGGALALVSGAVTLVALAVSVWLLVHAIRENASGGVDEARRFVDRVTIALSLFAIVAILWTATPLWIHRACDVQRSS